MFLGREVSRNQDFSDDTARRIDAEVNRMLAESHDRARRILEQYRDRLDLVAKRLIEQETLDGREVDELVKFGRVLSEEERTPAATEAPAAVAGDVPSAGETPGESAVPAP